MGVDALRFASRLTVRLGAGMTGLACCLCSELEFPE